MQLLRALLRIPRRHAFGASVALALALLLYFIFTPRWTARSVLVVSGELPSVSGSALSSLAATAGLGMFGSGTPLELVRTLALDEQVLRNVVTAPVPSTEGEVPIARVIGISEPLEGAALSNAVRKLRGSLGVGLDVTAQSLSLSVQVHDSIAARPVLETIIRLVDSTHRASQASQAREMRAFMEQQAAAARRQLDRSEDSLAAFLQQNRTLGSPRLELRAARLQRLVDLDRQWAQSLEYQLAQAVFAEAKNTPMLVAAVRPLDPLTPDKSRWQRGLLLSLALVAAAWSTLWIVRPRLEAYLGARSSGE